MTSVLPARCPRNVSLEHLQQLAKRRFDRSIETSTRFFQAHAEEISLACLDMAARFERGCRLLVLGSNAQASDASHVTVEFNHPVLVGKRALPAIATGDSFEAIARKDDILLVIANADVSPFLARLHHGRALGMLSIVLAGEVAARVDADFVFSVASPDALVVQEVHETLYHVLWELVHVFLERRPRS